MTSNSRLKSNWSLKNTLLFALCTLFLHACSTAASMRVEVEVYKGPLTKTLEIQKGELIAYIEEAGRGLKNFNKFFRGAPPLKPERGAQETGDAATTTTEAGNKTPWDVIEDAIGSDPIRAINVESLRYHINDLLTEKELLNTISAKDLDSEDLQKISLFANRLKSMGFYWSTHITFSRNDRAIRKFGTDFANMVSQYANQIESRADALQKQMKESKGGKGIAPRHLALSTYLRDTSPTDFINLYTWNRAADLEIWENYVLHPMESLSSEGTANRVRTFEHLFADQHWSKINTVFASGQGDVRMAFVKDDIGNWNLKSFDQDPTEILKAYTNLTLAVIEGVTETIAGSATGAVGAKAGMDVISRLTQGQIGSGGDPAKELKIKQMREDVEKKLEDLKTKLEPKDPTDKDAIKKAVEKAVDEAKEILKNYKTYLDEL